MEFNIDEIRERFYPLLCEKLSWGKYATFVPNKKEPVYNWIYYKEGFSRTLALELLKMFSPKGKVLDPFCGVGTTLLACKEKDLDSIGYDVLPISIFASYVKTRNYDAQKLKDSLNFLLKQKYCTPDIPQLPAIMKKGFSHHTLNDIFFFLDILKNLEQKEQTFFLLALINTAMKLSYIWKDGAVLKIKKKPTPSFRKMFSRISSRMISDLSKLHFTEKEPVVEQQDARMMKLRDEITAVITSPPYLNNIDYTNVYEIENFLIKGVIEPGIRSYIGFGSGYDLSLAEKQYFKDMDMFFSSLYNACKHGADIGVVVGNAYMQEVIESDIILSWLAEKKGFAIKKIYVLNKRFALQNRTKKKGTLRESLIIMRKD